ncbi:MAG: hypothetical protein EOO01_27635 [Chitinophagaceae bacterium]|nr:MAG: hypothetical protein EOO01_27635 [Chitinophagaceae bacterium]
MIKTFLLLFCLLACFNQPHAQEKYDIVQYAAPADWKVEDLQTVRTYSRIDGGSWAQIGIYKSTASLGSIEKDAQNEWEKIVTSQHPVEKEELNPPQTAGEWSVVTRSGVWQYKGSNVATILVTYSNNNVCLSILCNATAQPYLAMYKNFIGTVELIDSVAAPANVQVGAKEPVNTNTPVKDQFKYNTTNFDDGWISMIQADWVNVSKGSITTLLHFPKEGTVFQADPDVLTNAAWNILVAPRYSNISNYKTSYISDYIRQYYGMASAVENSTGKPVFILLFRSEGGWIECVAPDKNAFIQEFKFDPEAINYNSEPAISKPVSKMANYNKFAVAAADLDNTGEWSANFSSNTFYSSYYTGAYLGMSTYTSYEWYDFGKNQSYKWEIGGGTFQGGQNNFKSAKGSGTFKLVNEWKMHFTNKSGKAKNYDAYFTAIKNGRVLWLNDADYKGSGIFTGFTQKK